MSIVVVNKKIPLEARILAVADSIDSNYPACNRQTCHRTHATSAT